MPPGVGISFPGKGLSSEEERAAGLAAGALSRLPRVLSHRL